ncbi:MAG: hypothetical protein MZV63_32000 [Marinilabiliales bacterium]|nr:hypothetical protein [Marinilabiliales bacterium]
METTDFEAANVEYITFWLMDPFSESRNFRGGEIYFNLGDISEDILRDGRKSYENGLPTSDLVTDVDTTDVGQGAYYSSTYTIIRQQARIKTIPGYRI